ncbi:zinc-dependent metalloprotease [Pedobacter sp. N23S346]|uniref:zinc-dependent metalloprotease n=1 Tax=Pedobacter sp. N23S346 TaxID=3402750 RepID=UPI003ABF2FE8
MKQLFITILCALSLNIFAQEKKDSTQVKATIGSYDKIATKTAIAKNGLFKVINNDNKWYFEVPDSLLNRYLLTVTRYVSTPQGLGNFGGEEVNEQTLYFEKGFGNKLFLRAAIYKQAAKDENSAIYKALSTSQENPIVAAFDIKAKNPETGSAVIDVTDLFKKESPVVSIPPTVKTDKKLGSLTDDRSFIETINTYPINIEIKTTKTYGVSGPGTSAAAGTGSVTLRLNTSMVLLPKVPMQKRLADERVGYFNNKYILFDEDKQRAQAQYFIQRYRLEPKTKDLAKYKRGELVEPQKQIVYYIDPATPKKWRPYLIQGINDWQKAFEQAGFKNAIVGKEWPEGDTTMSLEDARYSVIRYYASETPNAYGPRISDPRSGEIIESHVGWYHNVMKLVQNWYMIQAGAVDPRARKMNLDDELMGQLIRFVSSHEIGHTIGLKHNMGASSQTPVEKLRDKKWVEANGHTVSIMDYARFNYVAQPEDHISPAGIYPRIGDYDKWAIEWGYKNIFNTKDEFEEKEILNKLIIERLKANPRLWFGGEGKDQDPRSQTEDLGDDAIAASDYGIKNLQRIAPELVSWTYEPGDMYDNLKEMHKALKGQYTKYLYHVMKNIGNSYITTRSADEAGVVVTEVPAAKVKRAVGYLDRQLFNPPLWLYPKNITDRLEAKPMEEISEQQNQILNTLLSPGILYNLGQKALMSQNPYPVQEFLNDLGATTWHQFSGDQVKDTYLRNLQRAYLEKLARLINPKDVEDGKAMTLFQRSDVKLEALAHIQKIKLKVTQLIPVTTGINQTHLEDLLLEINKIINKNNKL